ncbi:MAG: hypothetical protein OXU23_14290 [Candidatus Poribacteria bacterium]|nr:hypothetical protein [Candidatus Poribacteria bacterium]
MENFDFGRLQEWLSQIVLIFLIIQFLIFGRAWRNLSKQVSWHIYTNAWASILTVIGIFGTFLGIFIGLLAFDIGNIEKSIPGLLGGLKLAFLTSLVGILSAIILKWNGLRQTQKRIDPSQEAIKDLAAQLGDTLTNVQTSGEINLLAQMVTLNTAIREEGRETRAVLGGIKEDLTGIHTSLTGGQNETIAQLQGLTTTVSEKHDHLTSTIAEKHDNLINLQTEEGNQTREKLTNLQAAFTDGQSVLRTQLENLATTFSTKHDLLIDEFQVFSRNVAESVAKLATDELIEALKTVIEDFNAKITEQFGENFKQLNEAVGKTVTWQEQYRQQMEELADEFRVAAESIEKSRESVALIAESSNTISSRSESIVTCTEKLDPILHTLNDQLDAFSELRQRALEALPLIENRLNELTANFSSAVQTAITDSHESVEIQRAALAEQTGHLQTTVEKTTQDLNELTTSFSGSVETSIAQTHDSMNQQQEALIRQFSELENAIGTASQHFEKTIDDIGSQLDSTFKESANYITQLTSGFTQELTQRLEGTLNEVTNGFRDAVTTAIADSQASMETQRTALSAHSSTLQTTINHVSEQIDGIMTNVSNTVNGSQSSMDQQRQELLRLTQQLQSNFKALETTLEAGLTESLESLAGKLAALSEKFVDDYTPLTEELHRLVSIAGRNQADPNFR